MSTIKAFFFAFIGGELNSFWTHAALLSGIFVAEVSVGIGVLLESPKEKALREWLGLAFVFGGIIISMFLTIALFVFDEGINGSQQSKIISLDERLAARSLSPDQIAKMSTVLRLYGSMGFAVYPYPDDKESTDIAGNIRSALAEAGWDNQENPNVVSPAPGVMAGISVQVGLGAPANTKDAATALVNMLNDDNISATLKLIPAEDLSRSFINVAVGIKP